MSSTNDEIWTRLQTELAETLGVDEEEVTPEANFFTDLGGESIDLLDLTFRLEHHFPIRMNFAELSTHWNQDESGRLTAEAQEALWTHLPILKEEELQSVADDGNWQQLLTINLIDRLLRFRLQSPVTPGAKAS